MIKEKTLSRRKTAQPVFNAATFLSLVVVHVFNSAADCRQCTCSRSGSRFFRSKQRLQLQPSAGSAILFTVCWCEITTAGYLLERVALSLAGGLSGGLIRQPQRQLVVQVNALTSFFLLIQGQIIYLSFTRLTNAGKFEMNSC